MQTYVNKKLKAAVVASNPVQAAKMLTEELRKFGVVADIKATSMKEAPKKKHVIIFDEVGNDNQ